MKMKARLKYHDFMTELRGGTHYGVFIDDTGNPGGENYKLLPPNRKTWVGVVLRPSQMPSVFNDFADLLLNLKSRFGISELHFTDIYGGTGEFRKMEWEERLGIFAVIAQGLKDSRCQIFVQSLEPDQLKEWRKELGLPGNLGVFNFGKVEDAALYFLLLRIKLYLQRSQAIERGTAHVFVDEGWKKSGIGLQSFGMFGPEFDLGKVCFASSKSIFLLQLADFAAFVLNRMQIIGSKDRVKPKERLVMEAIQPVVDLYQLNAGAQMRIHNDSGEVISRVEFGMEL